MKTALFPGSFDPFHEGHLDVLEKALQVFDRVIVAKGINLENYEPNPIWKVKLPANTRYIEFTGFVVDLAKRLNVDAIICGVRNGEDLETRTDRSRFWEDQGLKIPVIYIASDRNTEHLTSKAIRQIEKIQAKKRSYSKLPLSPESKLSR